MSLQYAGVEVWKRSWDTRFNVDTRASFFNSKFRKICNAIKTNFADRKCAAEQDQYYGWEYIVLANRRGRRIDKMIQQTNKIKVYLNVDKLINMLYNPNKKEGCRANVRSIQRMEQNIILWEESLDAIVRGFREDEETYGCVLCGQIYEKGRIYEEGGQLYDAFGAVRKHVRGRHGCTADYLLERNAELTGITDTQRTILRLMAEGADDKTIAAKVGIAYSTVRNHRYKLREKEKQAKLFAALMESMERKTRRPIELTDEGRIEDLHNTASMVDSRYNITAEETAKAVKTYMDENGAIIQFPAREKKKIIILREVMKNFTTGKEYSEKEINTALGRIYEDYATIRRSLIEYGFLERSEDCSVYRVRE